MVNRWGAQHFRLVNYDHLGMDQYLLIPFLGGWTSIYQLFWCSPGVQGFDTLPFAQINVCHVRKWWYAYAMINCINLGKSPVFRSHASKCGPRVFLEVRALDELSQHQLQVCAAALRIRLSLCRLIFYVTLEKRVALRHQVFNILSLIVSANRAYPVPITFPTWTTWTEKNHERLTWGPPFL